MIIRRFFLFFICFFSSLTYADFSSLPMPTDVFSAAPRGLVSQEDKMIEAEAQFIKRTFTRHIFRPEPLFGDDEDEAFLNLKGEKTLMYDILAMELARALARRDALGFKGMLQQGYTR